MSFYYNLLFQIGFLPISIWDVLDVLIVGFLIYQLYRLLRGSIALNIFLGVVILYILWMVVDALSMDLLKLLLGQFVSVGVLILIIIFQPEVRRFLLFLGNTTLNQRSNFLQGWLSKKFSNAVTLEDHEENVEKLKEVLWHLAKLKVGALIVLAKGANLDGIVTGGAVMNARISRRLVEAIFFKESPLHDGAVIITGNKIKSASVVLPLSDSLKIPKNAGLRHRAAVGVTEKSKVAAIVVSEETGDISFACQGKLKRKLTKEQLVKHLREWL